MNKLLTSIINILPEAQKVAIKSLVDRKRKTGEVTSSRSTQEQLSTIYDRIKNKLGSKILDPRIALKNEKISSEDHNKNMEDIFLDLSSLYSNVDNLSKLNSSQTTLLNSEYDKAKAAIYKLINDASVFALRSKYPDFNEVKVIDFNINTNKSNLSPKADINPKTRLLQLKPISFTRVHLSQRGNRYTKIYTKTYSKGTKGSLSKQFSPELMVDQSPETFWGNLVMADSPVSQVYELASSGTYNKIAIDGPVTEIYLLFSHTEQINTIRFLPFSEYPIKIIDVSYRSSPSSQVFTSVKDFYSTSTLDWEELNFESILVHELRIVVAQENYKKVIYHLPKNVAVNTDLFQQIFNTRSEQIINNDDVVDSDKAIQALNTVSSYTQALSLLEDIFNLSSADFTLYPESKFYDDVSQIINEIYSDIDPSIKSKVNNRLSTNETIEINKYEYVIGMREIEAGYTIYAPVSYYNSDKYDSNATISQVSLEVDERHTKFTTQWESGYQKTSIEWNIDFGDGRIIPIHPRNLVDDVDDIPSVKDERIVFNSSNQGFTRLGSYYASIYRLKKDGNVIPSTEYSVVKLTGGSPKLKITLNTGWLDNSIYTVDYAVDPDSYNIEVLDKFNSIPVNTPDIFSNTGPDNDITLSKYPFINYEVVNLTSHFNKEDDTSSWVFSPDQANIYSGQLKITPTIYDDQGDIVQTGSLTAYTISGIWGDRSGEAPLSLSGNSNLSLSYFGDIDGISFGYYLGIMDSSSFTEVYQFTDTTGLILYSPFKATLNEIKKWDASSTGMVFIGSLTGQISGYLQVDYTLGIGIKTDDQIFTLSNNTYTPVVITVGGVVANNITNYETLEHPSFSVNKRKDNLYQYIQAGKKIYFNQPIVGKEIKVSYNWVTNYISVLSTLRCNTLSTPDLTPKINQVKLLINNLVI